MSNSISPRPVEILLVEDNPGDIELMREHFKEASFPNHLHVVEDGHEALAFLRRQGKHAHAPRPDIILLDLNLPGKDGREVLKEVKADDMLRAIPVVVHTSSDADEDVFVSYDRHANCVLMKAQNFDEFRRMMAVFEAFWFAIARLPRRASG